MDSLFNERPVPLALMPALVRSQNPIILNDLSEPEPDIAVVRKKDNYYADRHPMPEEVLLIIEVADSSLERDRQAKLPLYAQAQIPQYWIVNLEKREIEVYQTPLSDQYRSRQITCRMMKSPSLLLALLQPLKPF